MRDGVAHVGYWTAPEARGRGLTSDALQTVTRWFLGDAGAAGSVRVAEAPGFTREGVLRQRFVLRGRRADVVMYSMLPGDPAAAR
jgi:RimJ/RimL family protein N-acetyltransferase